ncbi:hypothetical protein AAMO2058_001096400 [Amorphochlora amoebiformis]
MVPGDHTRIRLRLPRSLQLILALSLAQIMTIQAQDSCESVSFKRKWAGGLHSTGSASSRGILRVRGGQSEQGGPQGLGDPSTRNVSRFYLDVEKWSVERIAFKNPDIISQLKRRLSILKQMETAVGLQIALPDRSHIVLNGTKVQRYLANFLIHVYLSTRPGDGEDYAPDTANFSIILRHPYIEFIDLPTTAVTQVIGNSAVGKRTLSRIHEIFPVYVFVDEDNIIYGNKKRVFFVSNEPQRRHYVAEMLQPAEDFFRDTSVRWSPTRLRYIPAEEEMTPDEPDARPNEMKRPFHSRPPYNPTNNHKPNIKHTNNRQPWRQNNRFFACMVRVRVGLG